MSQSVRITYYGIEGEGKNLTEAKRQAGAVLEALVKDVGHMRRGWVGGYYGMVFRDQDGWQYSFTSPTAAEQHPNTAGFGRHHFQVGAYATAQEAERALRNHLAQLQTTVEVAEAMVMTVEDQRDIRRYFAQQDAYRQAKAEGKSDEDARQAMWTI